MEFRYRPRAVLDAADNVGVLADYVLKASKARNSQSRSISPIAASFVIQARSAPGGKNWSRARVREVRSYKESAGSDFVIAGCIEIAPTLR
jgi:hypothetical protein